jgi:hypothetical protein
MTQAWRDFGEPSSDLRAEQVRSNARCCSGDARPLRAYDLCRDAIRAVPNAGAVRRRPHTFLETPEAFVAAVATFLKLLPPQ